MEDEIEEPIDWQMAERLANKIVRVEDALEDNNIVQAYKRFEELSAAWDHLGAHLAEVNGYDR